MLLSGQEQEVMVARLGRWPWRRTEWMCLRYVLERKWVRSDKKKSHVSRMMHRCLACVTGCDGVIL